VLLQGFEDEFKCKAGKVMVHTETGGVLIKKNDQEKTLSEGVKTHFFQDWIQETASHDGLVKARNLQCS